MITSLPLEEITLESHVYKDLELDSFGIVELFTSLGEEFALVLPNDVENSPLQETISDAWEDYKAISNDMMFQHFVLLGFPKAASERLEEMKKLCMKYHVQPFSVGLICAWIVQMLNSKA